MSNTQHVNGAQQHDGCTGCIWRVDENPSAWCGMFRERPETLPCCQHDKFEIERSITGHMIRRNPMILIGMIQTTFNAPP